MTTILRAVPKAGEDYPQGIASEISITADGQLQVKCDDDETYEWMTTLLAESLFVEGHGFPSLKRGPDGKLVKDPAIRRYKLEGYVDLAQPPQQVLQAIRDGLEASDRFELSWVN
ncbi:hypothetical protein [Cystobacter fuscus]|uniref:hypothetical protein n=1 Tax=Cystobacter fuscus TaxID=43 RepID=UPI002B2F6960|nr:hypothetical protein F0U63_33635 [Cystobacter fuscus]